MCICVCMCEDCESVFMCEGEVFVSDVVYYKRVRLCLCVFVAVFVL